MRGGILMSVGYFPESLNQAILVGTMLVEKLCVVASYLSTMPARLQRRLAPELIRHIKVEYKLMVIIIIKRCVISLSLYIYIYVYIYVYVYAHKSAAILF